MTPRRLPSPMLRGLRLLPAAMLALASLLASAPAHAGEAEKAEHIQLYEEMRKYAARNAWGGVEANYKRLLELEKKGEVLTYEDHRLGAEAARSAGDMLACRARLARAASVKSSDEVASFLADIDANFGRVKIQFGGRAKEGVPAVPAVPPFAPEQRQAIAFANAKLSAHEPFDGLLPVGEYTIGETPFTVAAGLDITPVTVGGGAAVASSGGDFEVSGGFRVSVGGGGTFAGKADSGPITGNFGGGGLRLGVGYELAVSPVFGVLAQVGYHGMSGAAGTGGESITFDPSGPTPETDNYLRLGYGWLGGTARVSRLKIGAGPVFAVGKANVVTPASTQDAEYATASSVQYATQIGLVGLGGSVDVGLFDVGTYRVALGGDGGALFDAQRAWPWVAAALTFEPSFADAKTKERK